jgi:hypothetical protein
LTWFDGSAFYIQAHENEVCIGATDDGVYYYSSDGRHLSACIGSDRQIVTIENGDTVRFTLPDCRPESIASLVSTAYSWRGNKGRTGSKGSELTATRGVVYDDTGWDEYEAHAERDADQRDYAEWARKQGSLGHSDWVVFDDLARSAGYEGADDFMAQNGFDHEYEAFDYIDRRMYDERLDRDDYSAIEVIT